MEAKTLFSGDQKTVELRVGVVLPIASGKLPPGSAPFQEVKIKRLEMSDNGQLVRVTVETLQDDLIVFGLRELAFAWDTAMRQIDVELGRRYAREKKMPASSWSDYCHLGYSLEVEKMSMDMGPTFRDVTIAYTRKY